MLWRNLPWFNCGNIIRLYARSSIKVRLCLILNIRSNSPIVLLTLSVYHHIGILVAKANGKRFGGPFIDIPKDFENIYSSTTL